MHPKSHVLGVVLSAVLLATTAAVVGPAPLFDTPPSGIAAADPTDLAPADRLGTVAQRVRAQAAVLLEAALVASDELALADERFRPRDSVLRRVKAEGYFYYLRNDREFRQALADAEQRIGQGAPA